MLFRSAAPRFSYCPILVAAAPHFFLPKSRCGSVPAFYTAHFSLRQRPAFFCPILVAAAPRFLYCPFLVAAAPCFLYCPFLVAAAPTLFILTNSCCGSRSEEHTSELQSRENDLVCRLLLEKKNIPVHFITIYHKSTCI